MVPDPSRGGTGGLGAGWHQGLSQALLLFPHECVSVHQLDLSEGQRGAAAAPH